MAQQEQTGADPQWDGLVRREASLSIRSVDEGKRSVRFVVSTDDIDSHGDIVTQDWILDRYKRNPVVLWAHSRYGAPDEVVIGKAEDVEVTGDGLEATLVFAPRDISETADKVFRMVKGGFLKATSVGFRPHKVQLADLDDGREVYKLSRNELMEISVVPIPSNPNSVAKHAAEAERAFLRQLAGNAPAQRSLPFDNQGRAAADSQKDRPVMDKDREAEKALNEAKVAAAAAEKVASDLRTELKAAAAEADALRKSIDAEKAARAAVEGQLKAVEGQRLDAEIEAMVGVKITPAEKAEHVKLAAEIGLDRVKSILAMRPDLTLLKGVTVDGTPINTTQPAPAPVSNDDFGSASADIAKAALAAAGAN